MRDHTSLLAWQRARSVVLMGLELGRRHWTPWAAAIFQQLQRSSLSVQLNIAEGHARSSRRQFRHSLSIAYGSAVETKELLQLCAEAGIVPRGDLEPALQACTESQALILGLIRHCRDTH